MKHSSDADAEWGANGVSDDTGKLNTQALIDAGLFVDSGELAVRPLLKFAAKTDIGNFRDTNEDKFEFYEPDDPAILGSRGSLFAVSDGMGGAAAGQIASEQTLSMLIEAYYNYYNSGTLDGSPIDAETALQSAVLVANGKVHDYGKNIRPEWQGMGATLTCAAFLRNRVYVAQVGDSRAYLIRDEQIRQVTLDHSLAEENKRRGIQMAVPRNFLTRCIGAHPAVEPDIYVEMIKLGDLWVLCSDGLVGDVSDEQIRRTVLERDPAEAVCDLIAMAKQRDNGGRDNITVMVIAVRGMAPLSA